MASNYTAVAVPRKIVKKIDEQINNGLYSSKADFIKEAVRRQLERISETTAHQQQREASQ
jgi:Arc/MetJ-type ribon-helix-helix transcriptional regulator